MTTHTTMLFHDQCKDGFGSALAAWLTFKNDAVYVPVRYGEPPPPMPAEHKVLIADFSYPYATMLELLRVHPHVTILDHHLGSQEDVWQLMSEEHHNLTAVHDKTESGATLTWQHLHGEPWTMPRLYEYLRDADLWTWALPDSRAIAAALASGVDRTFEAWLPYVNNEHLEELVVPGNAIRRAEQSLVSAMVMQARTAFIGGYEVPAVNAPVLFSEAAHEAMQCVPNAAFGAYYFFLSNGKVKWGLRGESLVDLNAIAKHYGGGGHFNAASFTVEDGAIQFLNDALP